MTKNTIAMMSALAVAGVMLLGGCHYDSASYDYHYDGGQGDYHTGYVITETRHRPRARRHYTTGYNVGYHTGYHGGGGYISVGHSTSRYSHRSHGGYYHSGGHYGHGSHRSHYGHRSHGGYGGSIHIGGGGYYCD